MIGLRCQKPTWSSPQETVRRTSPRATASAARPASAGGNELSDLAFTLGARLGGLGLDGAPPGRGEDREGDEGEEPRDVEVEPVRQHELEADHERSRQRCELERVLPPGDEEDRDRGGDDGPFEPGLDVMQVREARVLVPVPDRERRRA